MNEIETLPAYELKSFLRWVARATEKYFEDPEVQRRFEIWQKERAEKQAQQEGGDTH